MGTIFTIGSPVLRQQTELVTNIDGRLVETVRSMFAIMYGANGIGLAANQIGIKQCFAVVDPAKAENPEARIILINPRILEADGASVGEEGCLSVPEVYGDVKRAERIVVAALDIEGIERVFECDGLLARVIQHEIDHLNGVLFVDRLSPADRLLLKPKLRKLQASSEKNML